MRLILLLAATLACGCIEESESEPAPSVRETGYIECTLSADCDGDLRCTAADGTAECVETDGGTCFADLCECWAARFCAAGDVCVSGDERFECVPPDAVEYPLTTVDARSMCPAPGSDTQMEISLILGGEDRENLSDLNRVAGLDARLGEVLTADAFEFSALPGRDFMGPEPATARRGQDTIGLTPTPTGLRYDAAAPSAERLLIMALDHSGSLIGEDPETGDIDLDRATDLRDERIAFLRTIYGPLPADTYASLIAFQGEQPILDPEYATPTRNRDLIVTGLTDFESGSQGATPLAAALTAIRESIVEPNAELSASVLLFTDGVEGGDPGDPDRARLDAEIEAYAAANITVFVVQLRPPGASGNSRERDPKLIELACRTGGEYIFVREPAAFTDPRTDMARWFAARQAGVWRLTVDLPELDAQAAGWWSVATRMALQLGAVTAQLDLRLSDDAERDFDDKRLWLRRD